MSVTDTAATSASDERMLNKTIWRVMPMVTLCMAICTINRSNIGFASLTMAKSLGLSQSVFALGASLFYVGYVLLEIPSGLSAHKYGAVKWTARIMATWGICCILMTWTNSPTMFYILRFALGIAEAGLYPAMVYYISVWMPRAKHARSLGFLTIGSALGNAFGALVSGPLLDLNGALGLQGWQWMFLVTGIMPMIATVMVLTLMKEKPEDATFLSDADRARLVQLVKEDTIATKTAGSTLKALLNPLAVGFGLSYALILTALYGVIYWSPSIVKSFGVTGTQNGLLVAAPWLVNTALLLMIPRNLSRKTLLWLLIAVCAVGMPTFALSVFAHSVPLRYATLFVGIPCISLSIAFFWTFPIRMFQGAEAAAAIAVTSTLGNLGGLIGQNLMPNVAKWGGGDPSFALWVPCICLGLVLIGSAIALLRGAGNTQPA